MHSTNNSSLAISNIFLLILINVMHFRDQIFSSIR